PSGHRRTGAAELELHHIPQHRLPSRLRRDLLDAPQQEAIRWRSGFRYRSGVRNAGRETTSRRGAPDGWRSRLFLFRPLQGPLSRGGTRTMSTPMRGYTADKIAYQKRLRRVEGEVRGIARMVEDDSYCIDILTQISAATKELQAVALGLLEDHLNHCVRQAVEQGGEEADAKVQEAAA